LILIHGGPGAFGVTASGAAYYGALAGDGFDVYFYDQIGSGHSARLANPWEYTVARHVADLEAIRQRIGAEQVVLLGDSWGATLAANYMAIHPEHVARVIFTSPGPMSRADWRGSLTPASRLSAEQQRQSAALFEHPRFLAWQLLLERNVQAAYQFIPDAELDGFADTIIASFVDGALCEPAPLARADLNAGFGFWSMTMTNWDMSERHFDPHAALTTNTTPALILRGECDYIPPRVAAAYQSTLPHATLVTVPQAGHLIYYEQQELYLALVRAFLREQPLPPVKDGGWSRQDR
jgi:proline iminopeptidase